MKPLAVVGLSGGVDSALAAYLLQQQGYAVRGVFMQNWEDDDDDVYCSIKEDSLDAIAVADCLGIEIELVNFAAQYRERVFAYFLAEYQAGRTPNPDVLCNAEIKFKVFLEHALARGAQCIATGHYAATAHDTQGRTQLLRGADSSKDQSYFLYRLSQAQMAHARFPLGQMEKRDVRRIAREIGLPNHAKPDSTGICFIGERPFRAFLQNYLPRQPGPMRTPEGKEIGEHEGLMYYTLGQRKGIGIGGIRRPNEGGDSGRHAGAWYVAGKDLAHNALIVVQGREHPLLYRPSLEAMQLNWITGTPPPAGRYTARTRYRQQDEVCTLQHLSADRIAVHFDRPQWAITPGQSVVLYAGAACLGGGVIV